MNGEKGSGYNVTIHRRKTIRHHQCHDARNRHASITATTPSKVKGQCRKSLHEHEILEHEIDMIDFVRNAN